MAEQAQGEGKPSFSSTRIFFNTASNVSSLPVPPFCLLLRRPERKALTVTFHHSSAARMEAHNSVVSFMATRNHLQHAANP